MGKIFRVKQIKKNILEDLFIQKYYLKGYCGCEDNCSCYDVKEARIQTLEGVLYHFGMNDEQIEKEYKDFLKSNPRK